MQPSPSTARPSSASPRRTAAGHRRAGAGELLAQGSQAYEGAKNLQLPDGTVTNNAEYDRLRSEGDQARSKAKIAGGLALGTATITTALALWGYSDTGAIGAIRF